MSTGWNRVTGEVVLERLNTPDFTGAPKSAWRGGHVVSDDGAWIIGGDALTTALVDLQQRAVPQRHWVVDAGVAVGVREATATEKTALDRNPAVLGPARAAKLAAIDRAEAAQQDPADLGRMARKLAGQSGADLDAAVARLAQVSEEQEAKRVAVRAATSMAELDAVQTNSVVLGRPARAPE